MSDERIEVFVDRLHDSIVCQDGCGDLYNASRSRDTEVARRHTKATRHRTCVSVSVSRFYSLDDRP